MTHEAGRERLIAELKKMIELFSEAEARAEPVRTLLQRKMGWDKETLERMVSELLEEERRKYAPIF